MATTKWYISLALWPLLSFFSFLLYWDLNNFGDNNTYQKLDKTIVNFTISKPLIFQIGYPHMGTTTLSDFFNCSGYASKHGPFAVGNKVLKRLSNQQLPFADVTDKYSYFGDFKAPWIVPLNKSYKYLYQQLIHDYPYSKYILNIRNVNHWIKSSFMYPMHMKKAGGKNLTFWTKTKRNASDNVRIFQSKTKDYKTYICAAISHFYRNNITDNLILYDIEQDLPHKLVKYFSKFGIQLNVSKCYGHANAASVYSVKNRFLNNTNYQQQLKRYNEVIEKYPQYSGNNPAMKNTYAYLKNICNHNDDVITHSYV